MVICSNAIKIFSGGGGMGVVEVVNTINNYIYPNWFNQQTEKNLVARVRTHIFNRAVKCEK